MKILFTTRPKNLFSRLIKWGTDSDISHVALDFGNGVIMHSIATGVDIDYEEYFYNKNEVKYLAKFEHPRQEELMLKMRSYEGSMYDFGAVFYLTFFYLIKKCFNWEIPGRNRWAKGSHYMCTELAKDFLPEKENVSMITPEDLLRILEQSPDWEIISLNY